jgi:hypothetical protein
MINFWMSYPLQLQPFCRSKFRLDWSSAPKISNSYNIRLITQMGGSMVTLLKGCGDHNSLLMLSLSNHGWGLGSLLATWHVESKMYKKGVGSSLNGCLVRLKEHYVTLSWQTNESLPFSQLDHDFVGYLLSLL